MLFHFNLIKTRGARKTLLYSYRDICSSLSFWQLEYRITTTWDSLPVLQRPMTLRFKSGVQGLLMEVNAPFFDDPLASPGEAGQAFYGLWEYEGEKFSILSAQAKRNREHMWYMAVLLQYLLIFSEFPSTSCYSSWVSENLVIWKNEVRNCGTWRGMIVNN